MNIFLNKKFSVLKGLENITEVRRNSWLMGFIILFFT
jgi:hypothetical protein